MILLPALVFADGIIIIDHPPHQSREIVPLEIIYHRVKVDIIKGVAVTHVDEVFYNPNNMVLEGTFIFPIPKGASISELSLYIDGKKVDGEILQADEARDIYEDIVRRMKDFPTHIWNGIGPRKRERAITWVSGIERGTYRMLFNCSKEIPPPVKRFFLFGFLRTQV